MTRLINVQSPGHPKHGGDIKELDSLFWDYPKSHFLDRHDQCQLVLAESPVTLRLGSV